MVLEIVRQIIAQIAYYKKNYRLLYLAFTLQAINLCMGITDFVLMQMWRWNAPGRVCSGDYLVDTS